VLADSQDRTGLPELPVDRDLPDRPEVRVPPVSSDHPDLPGRWDLPARRDRPVIRAASVSLASRVWSAGLDLPVRRVRRAAVVAREILDRRDLEDLTAVKANEGQLVLQAGQVRHHTI